MKTKRQDAADAERQDSAPGLTFAEYVRLGELLGELLKRDPSAWSISFVCSIEKEDECPSVVLMTTRYTNGLMRMENVRYSPQGESEDD